MAEQAALRRVYFDLDSDERLVYEYTLGQHGKQKLKAGAIAREMGKSPAWVSRKRKKIADLLEREGY